MNKEQESKKGEDGKVEEKKKIMEELKEVAEEKVDRLDHQPDVDERLRVSETKEHRPCDLLSLYP